MPGFFWYLVTITLMVIAVFVGEWLYNRHRYRQEE